MSTATSSALERLEELRREVYAAERREQEAEAALRQRPRRLESAKGELRAYFVAIGAGDPPDPERERGLRERVRALEGVLVQELTHRYGVPRLEYVDPEAQGRVEAEFQAHQDALNAYNLFIRGHREELQRELTEQSLAARDELFAAIENLSGISSTWSGLSRTWRQFLEQWGAPSPAEIPLNPVPGIALQDIERMVMQARGGARDPRGAIPMPASLAPGAEREERHITPLRGWAHVPRVISSGDGTRLGT